MKRKSFLAQSLLCRREVIKVSRDPLSLSLSPLFCPLTRDATLDKHRIASIPIPAIDTGIERKEGGQRNGVAGRTAISTTAQIY
jgi:hypothetical protein